MTMNALGVWQKRNMVTVHTSTTAMLASRDCAADIRRRLCAVALARWRSDGDRTTLLLVEVSVVSMSWSGTARVLLDFFSLADDCFLEQPLVLVPLEEVPGDWFDWFDFKETIKLNH